MSHLPTAVNPSTALARVLVDELVRAGVREAVLAPGSRSAPLALALHAADASDRLRLHVRVDERSAAFLALGLAKVSGRAVPVLTTSGTAVANLHAAVLEASETGVALLVLSADRPPEARATGANQTVDQVGLFGSAVRMFHEVGAPGRLAGQNAYWRALACRAVAAAEGRLTDDPGPVHLNVALREPLVPTDDGGGSWPEGLDGRSGGGPWTTVAPRAPRRGPAHPGPGRTLVVVGDAPASLGVAVARIAEEYGWPVVSEPSGNAREGIAALRCGHLLLADRAFLARHPPARVLVVGHPTLHRSVATLLGDPGTRVEVVPAHARWADPGRAASAVLPGLPEAGAHGDPSDPSWAAAWHEADVVVSTAVDGVLAAAPAAPPPEATVARDLYAALPAGSLLVAGSSQPVRDLSLAVPRAGVTVLANRGAGGIDGTTSTAVGAALGWQRAGGGPAFALVGDLTFLHDANGLVMGPDEPRPDLALVVLHNDGGGIFGLLEPGAPELAAAFERVFGTPHGVDLAALCGATSTPYVRVSTAAEAVAAAVDPRPALQVVEVRTDRRAARALAGELAAAASGALAGLR